MHKSAEPRIRIIDPSELKYVRFLGQGAEGFVHEYMHDGRRIAVKDGQVEMDRGAKIGNPEKEAQTINYLHSRQVPHTIELIGFVPGDYVSENQHGPAFAMELLDREGFLDYETPDRQKRNISLLHYPHKITSDYPVSFPIGVNLVEQILQHVDGMIKSGISNMNDVEPTSIHRNVKTGKVTVTDFGLAVPVQAEEEVDRYLANMIKNLTPFPRGHIFYHPTEYLERVCQEVVQDDRLTAFHTVVDRLRKGYYKKNPTEFSNDYLDSFRSFLDKTKL